MPAVRTLGLPTRVVDGDMPARSSAPEINRPNTVPAPKGTALPVKPASPVPSGFPTGQIFQASNGSTWRYNSSTGQWFESSATPIFAPPAPAPPVPAAACRPSGGPPGNNYQWSQSSCAWMYLPGSAAAPGTPSPVYVPPPPAPIPQHIIMPPAPPPGQPIVSATPATPTPTAPIATSSSTGLPTAANPTAAASMFSPGTIYIDASTGQAEQVPGGTAAPATVPAATDWLTSAETWLASSSLISSIPNYWLVGGALLVGVLLAGGKRRR